MSVIIGADIAPTESNQSLFAKGNAKKLIGSELCSILSSADYCIANLEVPLTDHPNPIAKNGPNLIAPTDSVNGLKAIGIDLLTLANNHIMDQGTIGLQSTVQTLNKAGLLHVGAGRCLREAFSPFYFSVKGKKYGIYACTEHEFSIAGESTAGANPLDLLESPDHVARMKAECDYAIVLYHGGKEYYRYPSPNLQRTCRKLVEKGADLVICQHSHCIGCEEKYLDGTIIYGQGNFLFDHGSNEYWMTSLLVEIVDDGKLKYIPLIKKENLVRLTEGKEADDILRAFDQRSRKIQEAGFISSVYQEFAKKNIKNYALQLSGKSESVIFRALNKLSGYSLGKIVTEKYVARHGIVVRNYIECEAHRELLLKGLTDSGD